MPWSLPDGRACGGRGVRHLASSADTHPRGGSRPPLDGVVQWEAPAALFLTSPAATGSEQPFLLETVIILGGGDDVVNDLDVNNIAR